MLKSTLLVACAVATVSANFWDDLKDFVRGVGDFDYEHGLTVTIPSETQSDDGHLGTVRDGEFHYTIEPEHFCPSDYYGICDGEEYTEYYSRFNGDIPLESWAFPGGLRPGGPRVGVVIDGVFHYTLFPHEYAYEAAGAFFGYSLNREDSISKYSELFEKYHGAIPITAVEGAATEHEPARTTDSFDSEKHYSSYLEWKSDVVASLEEIDYVAIYNGVTFTRYFGDENYDVKAIMMISKLMDSMSSVSVKETGTPPSSDVSFSSMGNVNSQQTSGSGAVVTGALESSSASLDGDSASSNSKAGAALLAPLSSFLALGLMII
ncbi:hypothetical protein DICA3_E08064 [Diutina catenulata]